MAINRTYGEIKYDKPYKKWVITAAEPHMCMMLKRVFEKIGKTDIVPFSFPDSEEVSTDLDWFMLRHPLKISAQDLAHIKRSKKRYHAYMNELEQLTLPDYVPAHYELNEGMTARNYQAAGADILYKTKRMLIGDDLGLGKTVVQILSFLKSRTLPAAVVVQSHLTKQWEYEINKFTSLKVHIIKKGFIYDLPVADVYIFRYGILKGWVDMFAFKNFFKSCSFDEIQELRHKDTAKYKAAKILSDRVEIASGLSATPIYSYAEEIFNVLDLLKSGCLGTFEQFKNEWCKGNYSGTKLLIEDPDAFGSYLRENYLFLRRTRADVGMELPAINKIVHTIDYDEESMNKDLELMKILAYTVLKSNQFTERGQASRELNALVRHATGVAKAPFVAEYLKILLDNNIPIVVTAWHRQVYKILAKNLKEYNPVFYTGAESPAQKKISFNKFTNGETNLFIISLRSGAGLNGLQYRSSTIIHAELDYVPNVHKQVTGRIDRPGQPDPVTEIFLNSDNGSDPVIITILGLKASLSHSIIDPNVSPVASFSDNSYIKKLAEKYFDEKYADEYNKLERSPCCGSIIITPGYCNECQNLII